MKRLNVSCFLTALCASPAIGSAPTMPLPMEVVRIWPGQPPGSENWSGAEIGLDAQLPAGKTHIVTNVTVPTLTAFRPRPGTANGTAMLVVPGGAFRALPWDLEGTEVAQWLSSHGITAFVVKYRVRPPADAPSGAESFDHWARRTAPARALAMADIRQALHVVRIKAGKYGVKPNRVGIIGFSAGAMATMGAVLASDASDRPDFAASIYGAIIGGDSPAAVSPPLFIVAAQDDPELPSEKSLDIYRRWTAAQRSAELHIYEKGGHGFGIRQRGLPVDQWPEAFEAWLKSHGLVPAAAHHFRGATPRSAKATVPAT